MLTIFIIRLIYGIILCALIYGFVMFIRVAKRTIKALDIFIRNNTNPDNKNDKGN